MLREITIKNFKSIADDTIELGRVNVFIGENGCGKSNILEAVGFASAALNDNNIIDNEDLITKGIRIAKPLLTISGFSKVKQKDKIRFNFCFSNNKDYMFDISPVEYENIKSKWSIERITKNQKLRTQYFNEYIVYLSEDKNDIENFEKYLNEIKQMKRKDTYYFDEYLIYTLNTPALRGFTHESRKEPVGIYGENLDMLLASFDKEEIEKIKKYHYMIDWLDDYLVDLQDIMKFKGYKLNRSKSTLYFTDKYMQKKNNMFSAENANEGILHILFYLALMISKRTPKFFAIDNIESCLNPHLCRHLMTELCTLAKEEDKQLLITTHNPSILDGLDLFDDEVRLFEVKRMENGHTKTRRIQLKPEVKNDVTGEKFKLSELWTRGFLGAISDKF